MSESGQRDLALIVRHALEVHSLLVSANLFWNSVDGLAKQIPSFSTLSRVRNTFSAQRDEARLAREHVEHLTERTREGRADRWAGGKMTPEVFRQAVGKIEGDDVLFGNERFNLARIADAVEQAGNTLAAALAKDEFPMPSFTLKTSPPSTP